MWTILASGERIRHGKWHYKMANCQKTKAWVDQVCRRLSRRRGQLQEESDCQSKWWDNRTILCWWQMPLRGRKTLKYFEGLQPSLLHSDLGKRVVRSYLFMVLRLHFDYHIPGADTKQRVLEWLKKRNLASQHYWALSICLLLIVAYMLQEIYACVAILLPTSLP